MGNEHVLGLKEFLSFIRTENGLFAGGIAVSGYLIFNSISYVIMPLFLSAFLGTGASYAYNYLKDRKEDLINRKRLNKFVLDDASGMRIAVSLFLIGFLISAMLSLLSMFVYITMAALGIFYSGGARVKEIFLIKNIYTGFVISLSLFMGAVANGVVPDSVFSYAFMVFLLGFAANILGDIRGYMGDESTGIITLPVVLGFAKTKIIISSVITFLSASVVLLNYLAFYPIIPFMMTALILLWMDRLRWCRFLLLSSFAFLPVFMMM